MQQGERAEAFRSTEQERADRQRGFIDSTAMALKGLASSSSPNMDLAILRNFKLGGTKKHERTLLVKADSDA